MRILHVIFTQDLGGSERYAAELANAQAAAGHTVRVLIRPQPRGGASIKDLIEPGVEVAAVARWGQGWHLKKHYKYFQPEVVHCHLAKAARLVGKVRPPCPAVATLHLDYKAKNYAGLDGLITINPQQEEQCRAQSYQGQVVRIHNWGTLRRPVTSAAVDACRRRIEADAESFVFGSVGRLHPGKGNADVIKAFQTIGEATTRLVIVGSGEEETYLKTLAAPDKRIHFVPATPELAGWYGSMDCYVSASESESFGQTLVEAMQAGCPLIATDTVGTQVVLAKQPAGKVIPVKNAGALVIAMAEALAQGRQRQMYNLKPFEKAGQVAKIEEFYRKMLP